MRRFMVGVAIVALSTAACGGGPVARKAGGAIEGYRMTIRTVSGPARVRWTANVDLRSQASVVLVDYAFPSPGPGSSGGAPSGSSPFGGFINAFSGGGSPGSTVPTTQEMLVMKSGAYMRITSEMRDGLDPPAPPDKQWVSLGGPVPAGSGSNLGLGGPSDDPARWFRYLKSHALGVRKQGNESIAGNQLTRYVFDVDPRDQYRAYRSQISKAQYRSVLAGMPASLPLTVWVGTDDLIYHLTYSTSQGGTRTSMIADLDYSSFDPVAPPAPAQIYSPPGGLFGGSTTRGTFTCSGSTYTSSSSSSTTSSCGP